MVFVSCYSDVETVKKAIERYESIAGCYNQFRKEQSSATGSLET